MSENRVRYHILDELRGFMVVCMIFFHGFYLGGYAFGISFFAKLYDFFLPVEPIFAAAFIFICGFCTYLSRSNFKRVIAIFVVAYGVTLVTYIMTFFGMNELILFGVLHLMGFCTLFAVIFKKWLVRLPGAVFAAAFLLLFLAAYDLPEGRLVLLAYDLPRSLYSSNNLFWLGFPSASFSAGDYFPLIPWMFIFFSGFFTATATRGKLPRFFERSIIKPFSFLGRHALICYIIHQPLWYGIFYLLTILGIIK